MKNEIQALILENLFLSVTAKKKILENLEKLSESQQKAMLKLLKTAQKHQDFLIKSATGDKNFMANLKHELQHEKRQDDRIREDLNQTEEAKVIEILEAEIAKL